MRLSSNFDSREFVVSSQHPELVNDIWLSLTELDLYKFYLQAKLLLQPVRTYIDRPLHITSGKRSKELNTAIKGSKTSDHLYLDECAAIDFKFDNSCDTSQAFWWLRNRYLCFGQLIRYPDKNDNDTFIHISTPSKKHHGEVLQKVNGIFEKL